MIRARMESVVREIVAMIRKNPNQELVLHLVKNERFKKNDRAKG